MTLKARLTWRFLLWLILFLGGMFLLYFLVMISLFGINIPGGENPYIGDVMRNMKKATVVEGEQVRLSEEGIRELERLSAWLQILDDQGEEVYRRGDRGNSPGDIPLAACRILWLFRISTLGTAV